MMLDKIQGAKTDLIDKSTSLDRINGINTENLQKDDDSSFIIDESEISHEAFEKYVRELDVKRFSKMLLEYDEDEATNLVLKKAFDGTISIDDDEFMSDLLSNTDLLNDII